VNFTCDDGKIKTNNGIKPINKRILTRWAELLFWWYINPQVYRV